MSIGIYGIQNKINKKIYIGKSINIEKRWKGHIREASKNDISYLYRAMKKYGIENFDFIIIEETTKEKLNDKERFYIQKFDSRNPLRGYNLTRGGDGGLPWNKLPNGNPNLNMTLETKEKMSKSHKKRLEDPLERAKHACHGEKNRSWGKPQPENVKKALLEASKRNWANLDPSEYHKFSDANIGKKWWTNGIEDKFAFECPLGFRAGRRKTNTKLGRNQYFKD